MNESTKILTSVLHTAQMGISGIEAVENKAIHPELKALLLQQLREYQTIAAESQAIAAEKGWQLPRRNILVEKMSTVCAKCRLLAGDTDSTIAGMLIQGNTRGMILGQKNLNNAHTADQEVSAIAGKLLNTETINIQKSREFL